MNVATLVEAAVFYRNLAGELQCYLTRTDPTACATVAEAAALLRQGKPALIRVEDVPAVLAALEHACEAAAAPTGTAQGAQ